VLFAGLALLVRWPFIVRAESLLVCDEAVVGLMAQDISEGQRYPLYYYGQRYMGALEAYVVAALRPLAGPAIALHLGPACFFAALTALEYLLLTRWFGRRGGVAGAATLLAAAPMFVAWSIAARGAYIELLFWGVLLWWAYWEWFVAAPPEARSAWQRFVLGALIGFGAWLNPSIVIYLLPVLAHYLMQQPLQAARQDSLLGPLFRGLERLLLGLPLLLPVLGLLAVLALNCTSATWVTAEGRHSLLLLGLLPSPAAAVLLGLGGLAGLYVFLRRPFVRSWVHQIRPAAPPFVLGLLVGYAPALLYVLQRMGQGQPLEPALALGIRPLWTVPETWPYLVHGLPLLLGADPTPFLELMAAESGGLLCFGSWDQPVPDGLLALNGVVAAGLLAAVVVVIAQHGKELTALLRLQPGVYSPVALVLLAVSGLFTLYLLNGCVFDFPSIRYLVPLWAFVPCLLAATVASTRFPRAGLTSVVVLCLAWSTGQVAFLAQLGRPHPLREVAEQLQASGVPFARAEYRDAVILSFFTGQQPRVAEYEPFWPRLAHYEENAAAQTPMTYIARRPGLGCAGGWPFPGAAPSMTGLELAHRLRQWVADHPEDLLARRPFGDSYEAWTLARPLPADSTPGLMPP
jgi:hypothetical protein